MELCWCFFCSRKPCPYRLQPWTTSRPSFLHNAFSPSPGDARTLPRPVVDEKHASNSPRETTRRVQYVLAICRRFVLLGPMVCILYLYHCQYAGPPPRNTSDASESAPLPGVPKRIQRLWSQYAPWFPAAEYIPPPHGCDITQVNILQRHGARYQNADDEYDRSAKRLGRASKFTDPRLNFLADYKYALGEEMLVSFGAAQSFEAGEEAYRRYAHLVGPGSIPFVRASDAARVVDSAGNWMAGFAAASHQPLRPQVDVTLSEEVNSTLNNDCPNSGDGSVQMDLWLSTFAPPVLGLLKKAAPGANLSNQDVFNLLAVCPFETVASAKASRFCKLFTEHDFRAFEYHGDVEKYYKTGYGEPLGAVQGVEYVNELLARLTGTPVRDHTQTNASLPFPLGRAFYADFSHENTLVAVYAALGLFAVPPRDSRRMPQKGAPPWLAARMVPFSAPMIAERLACAGEARVRILVNDEVQPLAFCGARGDGVCALGVFVESQKYAREDGQGDFQKCYR